MSDLDLVISCLSEQAQRKGGDVARLACAAPRRAARGREHDRLWGILSLEGLIEAIGREEAAERVAKSFFGTPGSVTTALRAAVAAIRALPTGKGDHLSAVDVGLAVFRGGALYVGVFGDARAFLFRDGQLLPLGDEQLEITLAQGQSSVPGRFVQVSLQGGEKLLLTAANPPAEALRALADSWASAQGPADYAIALAGMEGLVCDFRPGKGRLQISEADRSRVWNGQEVDARVHTAGRRPMSSRSFAPGGNAGQTQVSLAGRAASGPAPIPAEVPSAPGWPPRQEESLEQEGLPVAAAGANSTRPESARRPHSSAGEMKGQGSGQGDGAWRVSLAKAARGIWRGVAKAGDRMRKLGRSLSPSAPAHAQASVPSKRGLILMAVILPLAVGLLGSWVYLRNGRAQAQQSYLESAQAYVEQASQGTDRTAQRGALQKALSLLDEADALGPSDSSQALRQRVSQLQAALGGSGRIEISPLALGEELVLGEVSGLSAGGGDLYVLDQRANRILRLYPTDRGYVHDPQFSCGPAGGGGEGAGGGKLVAMTSLAANDPFGSGVLALDSAGNLWICARGAASQKQALAQPDTGWGLLSGLASSSTEILVLDTQNNGLWRYEIGPQGYDGKAHLFFDAQIPNLKDVVSIALLGDELYLLHETGQMSVCTYSELKAYKPTSCQDPASYSDGSAPGGTQLLTLPGTQFVAMQVTQPPDAWIYLLDRIQPALYRFNRQLGLHDVLELQLSQQTGELASAFALAEEGTLFISFGDRIYTAHLP